MNPLFLVGGLIAAAFLSPQNNPKSDKDQDFVETFFGEPSEIEKPDEKGIENPHENVVDTEQVATNAPKGSVIRGVPVSPPAKEEVAEKKPNQKKEVKKNEVIEPKATEKEPITAKSKSGGKSASGKSKSGDGGLVDDKDKTTEVEV